MVGDRQVSQAYTGTTKALFALPEDYRFRLELPPWDRADTVVSFWNAAGGERDLTDLELTWTSEFLWVAPTDLDWSSPLITQHRITVYRRPEMLQTWDPAASSSINLPAQASRLDRIIRMIQAVAERAFNSLGFHPQETTWSDRKTPKSGRTIPMASDRRGRVLGFADTDEAPIQMVSIDLQTSIKVSPAVIALQADGDGIIEDYSGTLVTVQVLRGLKDETDAWAIVFEASPGVTLAPQESTAVVTEIAANVLTGWINVEASTGGGETLTFRVAIVVTKVGTPGAAAPNLRITGPQVFSYPSGATTPVPATPKTLTATVYHLVVGEVLWRYWTGSAWSIINDPDHVSGASTLAITVSHDSTLWSDKQVRLRCEATDGDVIVADEITLYKVFDGDVGYTIILTNETHSVPCDAAGTPNSGELGVTGRAKTDVIVKRGAQSLVGVTTVPGAGQFRISSVTPEHATATIEDTDTVRIDTVTEASGKVDIAIQLEGTDNTITKTMTWSKALAGAIGPSNGEQGPRAWTYLGAHTVNPSIDVVEGDIYLYTTTLTEGLGDSELRRYNGTEWVRIDTPTSDQISAAFSDIADRETFYSGSAKAVYQFGVFKRLFTAILSAGEVDVTGTINAKRGVFSGELNAIAGQFATLSSTVLHSGLSWTNVTEGAFFTWASTELPTNKTYPAKGTVKQGSTELSISALVKVSGAVTIKGYDSAGVLRSISCSSSSSTLLQSVVLDIVSSGVASSGSFTPDIDNLYHLGTSAYRWASLRAVQAYLTSLFASYLSISGDIDLTGAVTGARGAFTGAITAGSARFGGLQALAGAIVQTANNATTTLSALAVGQAVVCRMTDMYSRVIRTPSATGTYLYFCIGVDTIESTFIPTVVHLAGVASASTDITASCESGIVYCVRLL